MSDPATGKHKSRIPEAATAQPSAPVLTLSGVGFAYSDRQVLRDVSLTVNQGDYLAILGPNGGGKTTLLKCILGLLTPQRGSVAVFGKPPHTVRSRIGYVPQNTNTRDNFPISVLDAVIMGTIGSRCSLFSSAWRNSRKAEQKAVEALNQVGLHDMEHVQMSDLSGGQRQRVIVARALMNDPELLLLDEPTANIDPQGKFCFYEFLGDLPGHITTIVVSHDLSIAASGFSGVAVVNRTLFYQSGGRLTHDLLARMYGEHEPTCPMGAFINSAAGLVPHVEEITPPADTEQNNKRTAD